MIRALVDVLPVGLLILSLPALALLLSTRNDRRAHMARRRRARALQALERLHRAQPTR